MRPRTACRPLAPSFPEDRFSASIGMQAAQTRAEKRTGKSDCQAARSNRSYWIQWAALSVYSQVAWMRSGSRAGVGQCRERRIGTFDSDLFAVPRSHS